MSNEADLQIGKEVVSRAARHVDDVLVLHGVLVHLTGLPHHDRRIHVYRVRGVLRQYTHHRQRKAKDMCQTHAIASCALRTNCLRVDGSRRMVPSAKEIR